MPASDDSRPLALQLCGVEFGYPAHAVLRGIDLALSPGTFCCLLGPNGSGKTTLLQVCAGALRADRGSVRVFGRRLADWNRRELARLVAVVPQRFELSFPFSVEEVVLLGRVPHRGPLALDRPEDREIARQAMESTEVTHLAARRMSELSGGELKRVVVAKALAQQPRLLLLDEAASHLDVRHQVRLYELIDRVRRQTGMSVLAAVHDLNLAAAYGERFALLAAGELVAFGPLEQVMTYQRLRDVFGIDIYVGFNELTGHRLFTPMIRQPGGPR